MGAVQNPQQGVIQLMALLFQNFHNFTLSIYHTLNTVLTQIYKISHEVRVQSTTLAYISCFPDIRAALAACVTKKLMRFAYLFGVGRLNVLPQVFSRQLLPFSSQQNCVIFVLIMMIFDVRFLFDTPPATKFVVCFPFQPIKWIFQFIAAFPAFSSISIRHLYIFDLFNVELNRWVLPEETLNPLACILFSLNYICVDGSMALYFSFLVGAFHDRFEAEERNIFKMFFNSLL